MERVKRASLREGLKEDGTQFTHTLGILEQNEKEPTIVSIGCMYSFYYRTQTEVDAVWSRIYILYPHWNYSYGIYTTWVWACTMMSTRSAHVCVL